MGLADWMSFNCRLRFLWKKNYVNFLSAVTIIPSRMKAGQSNSIGIKMSVPSIQFH